MVVPLHDILQLCHAILVKFVRISLQSARISQSSLRKTGIVVQLKGPVEKGHKWWFEVKMEIGAIQLNIGTQAGFNVRNTVVHLFLDLRFKIWRELAYYFCIKSFVELNSLKQSMNDFFCSLPELPVKQRNST